MERGVKLLSILRHAKSSWKDASVEDHDRPLARRGERDAPRMGRLMLDEDLVPDVILSSTARRARDTAVQAAEASVFEGEIRLVRKLYLAGPDAFIEVLSGLPASVAHAMVVAHNPGLEELLAALVREAYPLPTAALAVVELPVEDWTGLRDGPVGKLRRLWLPRELDRT
jgi:phosphohistidine phosphatase